MSMRTDEGRSRLLAPLEEGARRCLEQLEKISGEAWKADSLFLEEASGDRLEALLGASMEECHGDWFTMPGAAFLLLFPRNPGQRLINRFTRDHAEPIDTLTKRDSKVLAEIANILVNAFVTPLAQALDEELIVSSPQSLLDTQRELALAVIKKLSRPGEPCVFCLARFFSPGRGGKLSVLILLEPETLARLHPA